MKRLLSALLLVSGALAFFPAQAAFVLTFEGAGNQCNLNNFYNGGTDSCGNSGTNFGVAFGSNSLALIDADAGGDGNFANEPTPNTIMFFLTGTAILNYAAGFQDGFSFYYTTSGPATVSVWSGLDATGTLLGEIDLARNIDGCTGDPSGSFCRFSVGALAFAGTAMSIDFGGTVNQVGFDNITFGSTNPNVGGKVPEPGTLALLAFALAGLALGTRRRTV